MQKPRFQTQIVPKNSRAECGIRTIHPHESEAISENISNVGAIILKSSTHGTFQDSLEQIMCEMLDPAGEKQI